MSQHQSRRVRVCFATTEYPPHVGGMARSAKRLVRGLVQDGHEVTVFTLPTEKRPRSTPPVKEDGAVVYTVPPRLNGIVEMIDEVDRVCRFEVFHAFPLIAAIPCLNIASSLKRPVIASIRGIDGMEFDSRALRVLRESSWITSVSRDSISRAIEFADISDRSSFIPNAVEVSNFPQWRPSVANQGVVGTVATFRPKKNIPLLIRAYSEIDVSLRKRLLLVGDAYYGGRIDEPEMQRINEVIEHRNLCSEVAITGYIDNSSVADQLLSMRVFVMSSDHEGLSNAILEAAAAGIPIVSTAVDGVKDIFTPDVDALLVPPGDLGKLAAAIRRVLADVDLACRLSEGAKRTASKFTPEAERRAYVALYNQLLDRRQ